MKEIEVKTKRLILRPLSDSEIEALTERIDDEELCTAYGEMLERPLTNWSTIYMLFGMSIGMAIGRFQDQMLWGMAIGISLGVLVGTLLNHSAKKNREALRQQRHPHA